MTSIERCALGFAFAVSVCAVFVAVSWIAWAVTVVGIGLVLYWIYEEVA